LSFWENVVKPTTIHTLLIANRCEIASRIIASAHAMGIKTVAVYSAEDAHAPYVTQASAAYRIPGNGAPAYLNGAALIALAHKAGAVAIHPGYGFLAENASFAQHVIDAGLVWIGPQPGHIAAMGDKAAARTLAATLGVPTVPGAHVNGSDPEAFFACTKAGIVHWISSAA
jgi:acetyl/propionyl-CoA carboxylase alpha subunit